MAITQTHFQRTGIESMKLIKAAPAVTFLGYKLKQYMQQKCPKNIWVLNESVTTVVDSTKWLPEENYFPWKSENQSWPLCPLIIVQRLFKTFLLLALAICSICWPGYCWTLTLVTAVPKDSIFAGAFASISDKTKTSLLTGYFVTFVYLLALRFSKQKSAPATVLEN